MRQHFVDDDIREPSPIRGSRRSSAGEAHDVRATIRETPLRNGRDLLPKRQPINQYARSGGNSDRLAGRTQAEVYMVSARASVSVRHKLLPGIGARADKRQRGNFVL